MPALRVVERLRDAPMFTLAWRSAAIFTATLALISLSGLAAP